MIDHYYAGKPVVVTGAGGFIGSHLVEALVRMGAQVRALTHYNSRGDAGLLGTLPEEIRSEVEVISADLKDLPVLTGLFKPDDTVFHLGALISIPYSYSNPAGFVEANIVGTLNVLQAARDRQVRRVVHTSSSEVYGTALRVPIDESHPLQGQSPYSATKIGADKLAESFHLAFGVPVVTLRPFNTYGPRQSDRAVIPTIIAQALTSSSIRLGSLDTRRDFTYVADTVEGFLAAGCVAGVEGMTINLGSGSDVQIGDLARIIIEMVGREVEINMEASRMRPDRSEVRRLISDNRLARERLGWIPQVDLREGLARTIEWISRNMGFYVPQSYHI